MSHHQPRSRLHLFSTAALVSLGLGLALSVPASAQAQSETSPAATDSAVPDPATPESPDASPADARAEQADDEAQMAEAIRRFDASLDLQSGVIVLGSGLAEMNVPPEFRYTGPAGAAKVLEAWGNPPGAETLGMVVPADTSPLADDAWAVVITYTEEGHVEDEDAKDLDFGELLAEMQKDAAESNAEREQAGFATVRLVGWAEPPHYDSENKKLYWAKELAFSGNDQNTLNYAIRVLGRRGVLELNAVASMSQLGEIQREMKTVLGFVEFKEGHRYADFDPKIDEVAAYGVGALIAGKAATKAGLFKGLFALLLASKKFLVVGVIALGAFLKGLIGRRKDSATPGAAG